MIARDTVDKINEAAHIEEVIGEFVTLKKRGANLLGLCPFHGEKTPSFTVSPVKGIYKCFGCGKAGGTVGFVMEHLSLTFPEALKWLAAKYGIEVEEKEITPEEREKQTERESMLIVMQYAARYFSETMYNTDEGKSVGLGYLRQRALRDDIIKKFQLGYSPEERNAFSKDAIKNSYQPKYLLSTGMSILSKHHVEGKEITASDLFDRFSGRVMFPIHDEGGRVVGFGGRNLNADAKTAKYINSPETDIYNKSRVLYGLWLGKKAIQGSDLCYLVEGYMDVIAMHQSGIENVVASSGTSLTSGQIKAVHRFTRNIVVLFDGDLAGQKASERAIPLLLEEGMNVKLLSFPGNDDPDSFSRKVGPEEFRDYLGKHAVDFLIFKAGKLVGETKNDPVKKAGVISDLVSNIALIPDNIIRNVYIKECAKIMEIAEQVLQFEVSKHRRNAKSYPKDTAEKSSAGENTAAAQEKASEAEAPAFTSESEERELLRIMLSHGNVLIKLDTEDESSEAQDLEITLAEFILFELWRDDISFENPVHQAVLDEFVHELSNQRLADAAFFMRSENPVISGFVVNNVISTHELSLKWVNFGVRVNSEVSNIKKASQHLLFSLKEKKLNAYISNIRESLKEADDEKSMEIVKEIHRLNILKNRVNKLLGRVVIK